MKKVDVETLPFQVQSLIDSLLNKKEPTHIRNNYRMRLFDISSAIEQSIKEFDNEMILSGKDKTVRK